MAVSKRLRFEILRRDGFRCYYCGRTPAAVELHVDHVVPVTLGGSDDPKNLVCACERCNGGKSSVPVDAPLVEAVSEQALKFAEAVQQVTAMRSREIADRLELTRWFMSVWNNWTDWRGDTYDTEGDEVQSIPQFIALGLSRADLEELTGVAMRSRAKDKWRYFCGCCWRRIRETQEQAAEIVREAVSPEPKTPLLQTVWTVEQIKEWWQEAMDDAKQADFKPATYCVHTPEGEYEHCGDVVCVAAIAAETLQLASDIEATRWKQKVLAERISDAAEEAEDYVYG